MKSDFYTDKHISPLNYNSVNVLFYEHNSSHALMNVRSLRKATGSPQEESRVCYINFTEKASRGNEPEIEAIVARYRCHNQRGGNYVEVDSSIKLGDLDFDTESGLNRAVDLDIRTEGKTWLGETYKNTNTNYCSMICGDSAESRFSKIRFVNSFSMKPSSNISR